MPKHRYNCFLKIFKMWSASRSFPPKYSTGPCHHFSHKGSWRREYISARNVVPIFSKMWQKIVFLWGKLEFKSKTRHEAHKATSGNGFMIDPLKIFLDRKTCGGFEPLPLTLLNATALFQCSCIILLCSSK